jgi:hypothetical protein
MLYVLVALALLGAVAPGWAETPAAARVTESSDAAKSGAGGKPQIQFASIEHDFGQADAGADLTTTFSFKNVGDAVLVIQRVKGG